MSRLIRERFGIANNTLWQAMILLTLVGHASFATALTIGVDAIHTPNSTNNLFSGSTYLPMLDIFRLGGNLIKPLTSFDSASLAGLDTVILKIPYAGNEADYTAGEIAALQNFARRAVFVSDNSMWGNNSAHLFQLNDNRQLLLNVARFISAKGLLVIGEGGSGAQVDNFNELAARFGISYAADSTDTEVRTVTNFNQHAITSGVQTIGVLLHRPMTITAPAIDLTVGSGQDNILAVFEVPEPSTLALAALGTLGLLVAARRRR